MLLVEACVDSMGGQESRYWNEQVINLIKYSMI